LISHFFCLSPLICGRTQATPKSPKTSATPNPVSIASRPCLTRQRDGIWGGFFLLNEQNFCRHARVCQENFLDAVVTRQVLRFLEGLL
jgi:hypothetical protein